jgi:hypothetical protein
MKDFFKTMDHDKSPPGLEKVWRENGLHLKSRRATIYSECCKWWLNDPLDDLTKVMENRGFLLLERALHSMVADARYSSMRLYLFMAASIDPPYIEGEE